MLALVLSGGSAWGMAHIGVIEILDEHDIDIDMIVGTSAGALVGALRAAGLNAQQMRKIASDITWGDLGDVQLPTMGLFDSSDIEETLEKYIGKDRGFASLSLPLKVICTDLQRGAQVVMDAGRVATAVRASSSIPVIFTPVVHEGRMLADGGLVNNLPVDVARDAGADRVIAVKFGYPFRNPPGNILEVAMRSLSIMQRQNMSDDAKNADVLLRPDVAGISPADLTQYETLIERGKQEAYRNLRKLKKLMQFACSL